MICDGVLTESVSGRAASASISSCRLRRFGARTGPELLDLLLGVCLAGDGDDGVCIVLVDESVVVAAVAVVLELVGAGVTTLGLSDRFRSNVLWCSMALISCATKSRISLTSAVPFAPVPTLVAPRPRKDI